MAVLTITISVPDDKAQDVLTSVTDYLGFDNTTTRPEWLRRYVRDLAKSWYVNAKGAAAEVAVVQARDSASATQFS